MSDVADSGKPSRRGSEVRDRERRITIRLTPAERSLLDAAADRAGLSLGSYVRAMTLAKPTMRATRRAPVDAAALSKLLGQLGRVGGNIYQIARHLNVAGLDAVRDPAMATLPDMLMELRQMKDALMTALGRGAAS